MVDEPKAGSPARRAWAERGFVALLAGFCLLAVIWLPRGELLQALRSANRGWLLLGFALHLLVFPLWALQWQLLARPLRPVAWHAMAGIISLSSLARLSITGIGGVAAGIAALHRRGGLNWPAACSLLSLDQALAGFAKIAVLLSLLVLMPLPAVVLHSLVGLAAALLLVAAVWLVLLRAAPGLQGRVAGRLRGVLLPYLQDMARSARPGPLALAALLALTKKGCEVGAAIAVQAACGLGTAPEAALLSVAAVSLATVAPLPATLGVPVLAISGTYAGLGLPLGAAVSIGLLQHGLAVAAALAFAALSLLRGRAGDGAAS